MSQVIYRKYRPQKFSDLVGQEYIKITLQNEIKTDKFGHAYLFSGPRGIGKTTTARLIAKSLNCLDRKAGESEPCNKCNHCLQIIAGNFLDLIEIDAASNRGIDEIRELRERVRFSPSNGKFKVFIIDEVHMLTTEAFNALLKTLEEPPAHAIFILATTELHKIPETIISRCQKFDFKRVSIKELVNRLEKLSKNEGVKVAKEVLEIIASKADGCLRDAESLLQQILSLGEKEITMEQAGLVLPHSDTKLITEFCEHLFQNDIKSALGLINNLVNQSIGLEYFVIDTTEFLRQILIFKANPSLLIGVTQESQDNLKKMSAQIENHRLVELIKLFLEKRKDLKQTDIPQLPLELLVLEFCDSSSTAKYQSSNIKPLNTGNDNNPDSVNNETIPKKEQPVISEQKVVEESFVEEKTNTIKENIVEDPISDNSKSTKKTGSQISLDKVNGSWSLILDKVKKQNHSIFAFLKTSQIISIKENIVEIGFPYKFHQDTINAPKNKKIIEDCISEIMNQDTRILVKHVEVTLEPDQPSQTEYSKNQDEILVNDMLAEFGGEIVA